MRPREEARRRGPGARARSSSQPTTSRQAGLAGGKGHAAYGESAWPGDVFYVFAPAIFAQLTLAAGCTLARAPALARLPANPFLTPIEILPEWYLLPAFNVLRLRAGKAGGVAEVLALLAALAAAPLSAPALLAPAQSPFRRPASCESCLHVVEVAAVWSPGGLQDVEEGAPWL